MVAAFGSGAMFSPVSGMDGPILATNGITSGLFFTLVQGGLFKYFSSALRDVRIPPGPRLLIHDRNRRSGSYSKAGHTITFGLTWNYSQCQMIFYSVRSFDIVLKLFKLW
ncbi:CHLOROPLASTIC IMPORT INNER MEMBRANE TRANSLOCASE SUBUNIT HP30-2 [Salix purpurea]|uniref:CHLOROPLASTIC IMPORT INNER MEMBRANE TRANSLOCASE SUBUNIT HP30-2 n=1 Tax=Salix purpurea TaxID=77065 RepID=A0A9Q0WY96_SALPP|nr:CHLOROPLASTIC IMPORT INNER MEMBRANE TRANSLOCASE SUBUNIT HP30-2 [Salix purpurea]